MKRIDISRDWTLQEGEPSQIPMMPAKTRTVHLPHDYMIESDVSPQARNGVNGGFYPGNTMSYTKMLDIPESWSGQRILVRFDGCSGLTKVVVNGHLVCHHHYNYTPFTPDITSLVKCGCKNRLTVTVGTDLGANSRWYSGGGVFRHVQLMTGPRVHLAENAVFAHLDHFVGSDAFVTLETTVENHTSEDVLRRVCLKAKPENGRASEAVGKIGVFIPAGEKAVCRTTLCFEDAQIWDLDKPELYLVKAELMDETDVTDFEETLFGVREITVDSKNGFRINGRSLKLKGGCIHSDNGILGAASFYDSEYRKVKLHKDNGFNALRFAHNPVSSEMLEACDRLGMLVFNEAFDTWKMSKNVYDFSLFFDSEGMTELENFIRRDRNHPCVAFWSIGNELPEQGGLSGGYELSAKLANSVRRMDPTRPVAGALCSLFSGLDDEDNQKFWQSMFASAGRTGIDVNNLDSEFGRRVWNEYTEFFAAPWDVVGYNYLNYHYAEAGTLFPNRVILATESKPKEFEEYWRDVERYPYVIGDFEWTSHDYIGEAGIGIVLHTEKENAAREANRLHRRGYPWRLANSGDFDLCGFEKPQLAFKRIVWGSKETYITVKDPRFFGKAELVGRYGWTDCAHSWTWDSEIGVSVEVEVYSSADEVELFLNGKSVGKSPARNKAGFVLSYQPGILEAVSTTNGIEVSRDRLETYGRPVGLKLIPEKMELIAGGDSLCFVRVEAVDGNGNFIPYVEMKIKAKAEGSASLIALGTGRGETEENYTKGEITLYKGTALAILRAESSPGDAVLAVESEILKSASISIPVK